MAQSDRKTQTLTPAVEELVERVVTTHGSGDLTLAASHQDTLRSIAADVRNRGSEKGSRGAGGLTTLFVGADRAGTTRAAELLARELGHDLYHVDLSRVVSKYIGETEKNLDRVFEAAESGKWVLLFDEADALFGKRTDVKDSHDRYANIEVGYLLDRLEAFDGLAILATNLKSSLDPAFGRRLRYLVDLSRG